MPLENGDLRTIPESPDNLGIKDALAETLDKANRAGIDVYLTGGIAGAIYAGETRPLPPELNFFVSPQTKEKIEQFFAGKFQPVQTSLFESDKLISASSNGITLNFIAEQTIVLDTDKPDEKITLRVNEFAKKKSLDSEFMGITVRILPPEIILIGKLFAGRGKEFNKYDLEDSLAIIESGIARADFLKKAIIEMGVENENVFPFILERLKTSLQKLIPQEPKKSPQIEAMIKAIEELEHDRKFPIEKITGVTRAAANIMGK